MSGRPVLLLGATGQVGQALAPLLTRRWPLVAPDRSELDLAEPGRVAGFVGAVSPSLIVNAAAFTDVDAAERTPGIATAVNADAPAALAAQARRLGIPILHYSTDYVFGTAAGISPPAPRVPWRETDAPSPVNAYGRSKLAGEQAVAGSGAAYLIFRLSGIYSRTGRNFLNTIRETARRQAEIRVVDDQHGSPSWADAIAEATVRVLMQCRRGGPDFTPGLYHLAAAGGASRYAMAREIVAATGAAARVVPVSSASMPGAPRPAWSVLDCTTLGQRFGIRLPHWRDQLRACLAAWREDEAPRRRYAV